MDTPSLLLIDDEVELVTTLVERLKLRGLDAEAAVNGREALDRIGEKHFDVVVADLKMPVMGGLEVMQTLQRDYPAIKVVLITGHGSGEDQVQQLVERADGLLLKPFSIDSLIEKVREVTGQVTGGSDGEG